MTYVLSHDVLTKILNYLSTRPWAEVHQLIVEITKSVNSVKETEINDGGDTKKSGES
jgi:hypothetical protein